MSKYLSKTFLKLFVDSPTLNFKKYLSYLIFDEHYYLSINKDVKKKALNHYITVGNQQGRCPHPLFDPIFYKANLVKNISQEPLKHYMAQKGDVVSPHILFDANYYVSQLKDKPKKQTLLEHFLEIGWKNNISPTPYFDFQYYYKNNPDIKNAHTNPFLHYLFHGEAEGRKPNATFDPKSYTIPLKPIFWNKFAYNTRSKLAFFVLEKENKTSYLKKPILISQTKKTNKRLLNKQLSKYEKVFSIFFDEDYYGEANWDIIISPIQHYLKYGSKEGRYPNPLFDPNFYRSRYITDTSNTAKKDNDLSNEPLVHYYNQPNELLVSPHPLFNAKYYLEQLNEKGIKVPTKLTFLEHFLKEGWKHNISPTPEFDVEFYLKKNPILKEAKINLFLHYLTVGEQTGLSPNTDFFPGIIQKPGIEHEKNNPVFMNESKLAMQVKGQLGLSTQIVIFKSDLRLFINKEKPTIICVSHEASRTGAPAIILKLAEQLKKYLQANVVCILLKGGDICADFRAVGPTYCFEHWCPPYEQISSRFLQEEVGAITETLKLLNPVAALVNSAESRNIFSSFKFRNIPTLALIHEMAYFYEKETFKDIGNYADFTVFPSQVVSDFASGNSKFPVSKTMVRGQGLLKPEILKLNRNKAALKLRKELNLADDAFIVMGCGALSKRKAPDFFVHTAIHIIQALRKEGKLEHSIDVKTIYELNEKSFTEHAHNLKNHSKKRTKFNENEIHFVWLGSEPGSFKDSFFWIDQDIIMSGIQDHIHFIGSKPDAENYFAGSDVFLMTSRADPFPCVIHEAMAAELPIIGFKDAGGFSEAITEECGKLVDYADTKAAADCILEWYKNPVKRAKLGANAKKRVISKYNYLDYTIDIAELLTKLGEQHLVDSKSAKLDKMILNLKQIKKEKQNKNIEIKERKKIIFTLPAWEISGVNTFVENLIKDLNKRGYNAYLLFTGNHSLNTPKEYMPDIPYRYLGMQEVFPVRWKRFIEYMEAEGPCVFVPNYDYFASAVCPALSNNISILGVLHSDDYEHYEHAYRTGLFWNQMVSVSKVIEKRMLQYNPRFKDMSSVIYYGIEAPLKRDIPKKREQFSIVYTGRIIKFQKRIMDFVEIAEKLEKTGIDYIFTFIGDGPDFEEFNNGMKSLITKLKIKPEKIRVLGRQPIERVYEELNKAHVFALCSDFEGLPLSLLEALSCYCVPVVTEIESGITEVLKHKKNAMISPIGDADAFVENLVALHEDEKKLKQMAVKAFDVLSEYKLRQEDMGEQYAKVIDKMFDELDAKTYKRPTSLNPDKIKNILLPPTYQKIPHGFDQWGNVYF